MHSSRRKFLRTSGLGLVSLCIGGFELKVLSSWIPKEVLQNRIPQLLQSAGLSRLSMSVLENGNIWSKQFGTPGADTNLTVFEAGSLSKPLAAVLALQLQSQGKLDLNKPLADYWSPPELQNVEQAQQVTAVHVLSHASGLQNWRFNAQDRLKLNFIPGTDFSYSGEGYVWLQQVMEHLTGSGYADLISKQVLTPLGMSNSSFDYKAELFDQMVPGHQRDGSLGDNYGERIGRAFKKIASTQNTNLSEWQMPKVLSEFKNVEPNLPALPVFVAPNAAGSLACTAEDYIRFIQALLAKDPQLGLSKQDYVSLFTKESKVTADISWGLGWGLAGNSIGEMIFHTSETRFFKGVALIDPKANKALTILTNGANGDRVYDQVSRQTTDLPLAFLNSF